jgi:hypothetical protein
MSVGPPWADDFAVEIFTVAEWADEKTPGGRVHLGGAGLGVVRVPDFPFSIPELFLVGRVRLPMRLTESTITVAVRFLWPDGSPVNPESDPLVSRVVGVTPPQDPHREPHSQLQFVLRMSGLRLARPGRVQLVLQVADEFSAACSFFAELDPDAEQDEAGPEGTDA